MAPKPLSLSASLLYFAIPSLLSALAMRVSIPLLDSLGVPLILNATLHYVVLLGGLGIAGIIGAYRDRERGTSVLQRLRLRPFKIVDGLIGLAVGVVGTWLYLQLQVTVPMMLRLLPFGIPAWSGRFASPTTFLDVPLAHHPWLLAIFVLIYVSNVVGEELWWRGYIFPRQIRAIGNLAFLPHALLWCGFHVFQAWEIIPLVPIALLLSFAVQRRKSTWIGIIGHGFLNVWPWVALWPHVTF